MGDKSLEKEGSILGKGVDTFKRDAAVAPLQTMMGKKHAGEPRFICSSKILEEPKVSLSNIDAFFKYKIPLQLSPAPPHI